MFYFKIGALEIKLSQVWITVKSIETVPRVISPEEKKEIVEKLQECVKMANELLSSEELKVFLDNKK